MRSILINDLLKQLEENPNWLSWLEKEIKGKNLIAMMTANEYESWSDFYPDGLKKLEIEMSAYTAQQQFALRILILQIYKQHCENDMSRWMWGKVWGYSLEAKKKAFADIQSDLGIAYKLSYQAYLRTIRTLAETHAINDIKVAFAKPNALNPQLFQSFYDLLDKFDPTLYGVLESVLISEFRMSSQSKERIFLEGLKNAGKVIFKQGNSGAIHSDALCDGRAKDFFQVALKGMLIKSKEACLAYEAEQPKRKTYT